MYFGISAIEKRHNHTSAGDLISREPLIGCRTCFFPLSSGVGAGYLAAYDIIASSPNEGRIERFPKLGLAAGGLSL